MERRKNGKCICIDATCSKTLLHEYHKFITFFLTKNSLHLFCLKIFYIHKLFRSIVSSSIILTSFLSSCLGPTEVELSACILPGVLTCWLFKRTERVSFMQTLKIVFNRLEIGNVSLVATPPRENFGESLLQLLNQINYIVSIMKSFTSENFTCENMGGNIFMLLSRIYVSLLITNAYVAAFKISVGTSTNVTKTTTALAI